MTNAEYERREMKNEIAKEKLIIDIRKLMSKVLNVSIREVEKVHRNDARLDKDDSEFFGDIRNALEKYISPKSHDASLMISTVIDAILHSYGFMWARNEKTRLFARKRLASTLLTEERFWEIIENSNQGKELEKELSNLTEDEIMGYRYWWNRFHSKLYNQELWAVGWTVLGWCSDDGFIDFRSWLLTRGKLVYEKAIENADSLCDEFDKLEEGEHPQWEDVAYIPSDVFKKKFGKDLYRALKNVNCEKERLPVLIFEWNEDDKEAIRKICPRTFDKWWYNDKCKLGDWCCRDKKSNEDTKGYTKDEGIKEGELIKTTLLNAVCKVLTKAGQERRAKKLFKEEN